MKKLYLYHLECLEQYRENQSIYITKLLIGSPGKKINRVACGSAHSLAWSTNKPVSAGKLPSVVPMEYNHLQTVLISALRNRLVLLHHFSDLFCPSIPMFDLQDRNISEAIEDNVRGLDSLRGVIVSSAKVHLQEDKKDQSQNRSKQF